MSQVPSPQSVESEQALLGGLLLDPERFEEIEREVATDDFYRPDHGRLFGLLKQMRVGGEPIDQVSVGERVLRGGKDEEFGGYGYVLALPEKVPARVNLGHYARIVECGGRLLLARAADETKDQSYMLAQLDPAKLDRIVFPLGGQTKTETRAEAAAGSREFADLEGAVGAIG